MSFYSAFVKNYSFVNKHVNAPFYCRSYVHLSPNMLCGHVPWQRNILRNLNNFLTFLENVKILFYVFGLSETWLNETKQNFHGIKGYPQANNSRLS